MTCDDRQAIFERVQALLLELSTDGIVPSSRIYETVRGDLPSRNKLRHMGTTLNQLGAGVGLVMRRAGVSPGQKTRDVTDAIASRIVVLSPDGDVSFDPPPNLHRDRLWSTGGMLVNRAYQNRRGEMVYSLR